MGERVFTRVAADDPSSAQTVLEAVERLLDAREQFDAPIMRELLRAAMIALVHECDLREAGGPLH